MTTQQSSVERKYVEAAAAVAAIARQQGTPEYDPRAHEAALERERKAAEAFKLHGR